MYCAWMSEALVMSRDCPQALGSKVTAVVTILSLGTVCISLTVGQRKVPKAFPRLTRLANTSSATELSRFTTPEKKI